MGETRIALRRGLVRRLLGFALAYSMLAGVACSKEGHAVFPDAAAVDAKDGLVVFTWHLDTAPVTPPGCGNGVHDQGELCDDGNTKSEDGCRLDCREEPGWRCPSFGKPCILLSDCGNGRKDPGEDCDDGNTIHGEGCSWACQIVAGWRCPEFGRPCISMHACGNGLRSPGEACDDGNTVGGDGCSADCTQIEPGWQCPAPGMPCSVVCAIDAGSCADGGSGVCGNAMVEPGEECDFGSDDSKSPHNGDGSYGGCTSNCMWGAYCGDGIVNGPEACDDGPANGALYGEPGCTFACTKARYCGDGIVDVDYDEHCDDGSYNSNDCGGMCSTRCESILLICH